MEYKILGPLEVSAGQRVLDLGSHKQRAVLAALLIDAGKVVSTETLIDRLWGENPPTTATGTLQAYISNLRKALERGRPDGAAGVIVRRSNGYALQVSENEIDAGRFEQLAQRGKLQLEMHEFTAARKTIQSALELWRGNPLSDFAFDDFAALEIQRLEERRISALQDRIETDLALGKHRALAGELRSLVEKYPLRERLRAQLMLALYRDGRQAEALEVCRQGREYLAEELGLDPGPELARLEEAILRHDATLDWRPPPAAARAIGPLLGRDPELRVLQDAADSVRSGAGRLVLLAGEPGIGKTRLVEEFSAGLEGFEVVWGRCYEGEGAPPLWPWLKILQSLAEARSAQRLLDIAGPESSELAAILPGVAVSETAASVARLDNVDAERARFRLWVSVTTLLTRLSAERPLALLLDDLHWADVATLRLLHFIATELRRARILVLGTYRDVDVESDHPLSDILASLARLPVVERVDLTGLDPGSVAACVASVSASEPSPESVKVIQDLAGGNPFFVAELVRLLEVKGELPAQPGSGKEVEVPANVRDVIQKRVSALPSETGRVLRSCAIIGREFQIELVAKVEGTDARSVLYALDPALGRRLVISSPLSPGSYRFSHALVRETLVASIPASTRTMLHARVAESLETLYGIGGDRVPQIAHHLFQAIGVAEVSKAVDYSVRAADAALSHLAYEQADEQLRRALSLLERMPPGPRRCSAELEAQVRLGGLLMITEGYSAPEAAAPLARACDLAREIDSPHLLPALWKLAAFHLVRASLDRAFEVTQELFDEAGRRHDPNWSWAANHTRGILTMTAGDLTAACRHFEEALELAESVRPALIAEILPERDATISCQGFLCWTQWLLGTSSKAAATAGSQVRRARSLSHPFGLVFALQFASGLSAMEQDAARLKQLSEELLALAQEHGFRLYEAIAGIYLGWAMASLGEPSEGSRRIASSLDAFEATGAKMLAGFHYSLLADAYRLAGQFGNALAATSRGLEIVNATRGYFFASELYRIRGELLRASSGTDSVEARACFERALETAASQGNGPLHVRASLAALGSPGRDTAASGTDHAPSFH